MDEFAKASVERMNVLKELTPSVSDLIRSNSNSVAGTSPTHQATRDERLQLLEDRMHALTTRWEGLRNLNNSEPGFIRNNFIIAKASGESTTRVWIAS